MTNEEKLRLFVKELKDTVEWSVTESQNMGESEIVTQMWMVFESMINKYLKKHGVKIDD